MPEDQPGASVDRPGVRDGPRLGAEQGEHAPGRTEVRARDVASALGRGTDSGSVNTVRSTLDRLVGASRVQRAGRGLYRAVMP
ncbi:hypothetical protein ACWDE0_37335 [Streptomyces sp. 900105755]